MLVNPISFRLSISIFWKFTWSLYQYDNYKYLFYSDLVVFQYFLFFFRRLLKSKKTDYYVSHLRLYRVKKNVIINLFYYNPSEEIIYKYLKIHFFKHKKNILLKKKKFLKYWKKKKKHYFSLNFFSFIKKKNIILNNILLKKKKNLKKRKNEKKKINKKIFRFKGLLGFVVFYELLPNGNYKRLKDNEGVNYEKKYWNFRKKVRNFFWQLKKKNRKLKWKRKKLKYKKKKKNRFNFIKLNKIKNNKIKKILKLKKLYLWRKKIKKNYKKNFSYLLKIFFYKFTFNLKFLIYNLYIYLLTKFLKKEFSLLFLKKFKNFKLNFYMISLKQITARLVGKYLKTKLQKRHNIWKALNPVLTDLNKRILLKQIKGFKIMVKGRFKRAQRATYLWKKTGVFLIGSVDAPLDYEVFLHKTKYGVCAIKIWITGGLKMFRYYQKNFPIFKIFHFFEKNKIFFLKKNEIFFNFFLKKFYIVYSKFTNKYIKNILLNILYKYLYINIFLKKIFIKKKFVYKKIKKIINFVLLPQYCLYKIYMEDIIKYNIIKIKPYINFVYLKKLNIRRAYKLSFLISKIKKKKWKIKIK